MERPTTNDIVIRNAAPDDVAGLASLLVQCFYGEMTHPISQVLVPLIRLGIQSDLQQRLREPPEYYRCITAWEKPLSPDQSHYPVATIELAQHQQYRLWPFSPRFLYVSNLAVAPSHRRQHIAQRLLNACESSAKQWGFSEIYLHVREDNVGARLLYEQAGYRVNRVDFNLGTLVLQQPRTLFLSKHLRRSGV